MSLEFSTSRLAVKELIAPLATAERSRLVQVLPTILTPEVVKDLPDYFQNIHSHSDAEQWLERMLSESRLLQISYGEHSVIGFLFVHVEADADAYIGYLLAEPYWGQGLASELLQGFIQVASQVEGWQQLLGGVAAANVASAKLLEKLGFKLLEIDEQGVRLYQYSLHSEWKPPLTRASLFDGD
jgi:RimJ/RimL family protein N-acetyltransferase